MPNSSQGCSLGNSGVSTDAFLRGYPKSDAVGASRPVKKGSSRSRARISVVVPSAPTAISRPTGRQALLSWRNAGPRCTVPYPLRSILSGRDTLRPDPPDEGDGTVTSMLGPQAFVTDRSNGTGVGARVAKPSSRTPLAQRSACVELRTQHCSRCMLIRCFRVSLPLPWSSGCG